MYVNVLTVIDITKFHTKYKYIYTRMRYTINKKIYISVEILLAQSIPNYNKRIDAI